MFSQFGLLDASALGLRKKEMDFIIRVPWAVTFRDIAALEIEGVPEQEPVEDREWLDEYVAAGKYHVHFRFLDRDPEKLLRRYRNPPRGRRFAHVALVTLICVCLKQANHPAYDVLKESDVLCASEEYANDNDGVHGLLNAETVMHVGLDVVNSQRIGEGVAEPVLFWFPTQLRLSS